MENNFASNLKHLRVQAGMTQDELAQKLDKDYSTIGKWELGQRSPMMVDVVKISELFQVPLETLIGGSVIYDNNEVKNTNDNIAIDELGILFNKAKPHLSEDDEATIKFIMNKTIDNYEKSKNQE